eukprot:TRINITY_DN7267_c0_g1_i1.p1 TRINITY_DN7267_c0_g1~~TRINITY_DN7267_c0_g1_i1.p1  ORF type:complete len:714 (+),score=239.10 TRINITY_DN7267_c0_g1_i1:119-2260(+)
MSEFYRTQGILAAFSLLAAFLIIITYLMVKEVRRHPTNLVFWLSVSDFMFAFKFVLTSVLPGSSALQENHSICYFQAIFAQFFGLASVTWNGMISLNLLFNMKNPFLNTASYTKWYHLWTWGTSAATTIIMVVIGEQAFGKSGDGTCWVINDYRLLFFVPLVIYFAISLVTLILAISRSRSIQNQLNSPNGIRPSSMAPNIKTGLLHDKVAGGNQYQSLESQSDGREHVGRNVEDDKLYYKLMIRMGFYVALFLVLWSFPLAHRIAQFKGQKDSSDDESATPLQYLDIIGVSMQGFANACVWLTNPSFWRSFTSGVLPSPVNNMINNMRASTTSHHQLESESLSRSSSRRNSTGSSHGSARNSTQDLQRIDVIIRKYIISCIVSGISANVTQIIESGEEGRALTKSDFDDMKTLKQSQGESSTFTDYAPLVFMKLRTNAGIDNHSYLEALEPGNFIRNLKNQKFSDGRSGSFFVFSPNKKFIIKTLTIDEAMLLFQILPQLYEFFKENPHSLINRFLGLHSISVLHGETTYVAVMQNVINTTRKLHRKYDLKGSWINRKVGKAHEDDNSVQGMDLDLVQKLKLSPKSKAAFLEQIERDSLFFSGLNIMDYSLLLAVHVLEPGEIETFAPEELEERDLQMGPMNRLNDGGMMSSDKTEIYYTGIIDILQLWDSKKKRERFFKVYMLQKDKWGISAQEPDVYSERFISSMKRIVE